MFQATQMLLQYVLAEFTILVLGGMNITTFVTNIRKWLVWCPVHQNGRMRCEVQGCGNAPDKYTRNHYTCLTVGKYHFFCSTHATRNCRVHPQGYRRN